MNDTAKPATVATNTNELNEKDECPKATRAKAEQALATRLQPIMSVIKGHIQYLI